MPYRKRHTALKVLELLQNIQEDNSDAESDAESDTSVYHLDEDNRDELERESLSGESLVSELLNSEIADFEDTETISETNQDHVQQNNATSFATSAEITWDLVDTNQNNSGRRSCHNVIRGAPGPSTQAHCSIIKELIRSALDVFIDEGMLRHIQRCTEEEAQRVLQTDNWHVSLHELDAFLAIIYAHGAHKAT